jgi:BCD family chlorophyll transporter-like MFS transporter
MNLAPAHQRGLALGTWGAVQASAAGIAVAIGGVLRDTIAGLTSRGYLGGLSSAPETAYTFVYALEVLLLFSTVIVLFPLIRRHRTHAAG